MSAKPKIITLRDNLAVYPLRYKTFLQESFSSPIPLYCTRGPCVSKHTGTKLRGRDRDASARDRTTGDDIRLRYDFATIVLRLVCLYGSLS